MPADICHRDTVSLRNDGAGGSSCVQTGRTVCRRPHRSKDVHRCGASGVPQGRSTCRISSHRRGTGKVAHRCADACETSGDRTVWTIDRRRNSRTVSLPCVDAYEPVHIIIHCVLQTVQPCPTEFKQIQFKTIQLKLKSLTTRAHMVALISVSVALSQTPKVKAEHLYIASSWTSSQKCSDMVHSFYPAKSPYLPFTS